MVSNDVKGVGRKLEKTRLQSALLGCGELKGDIEGASDARLVKSLVQMNYANQRRLAVLHYL